MEKKILVPITPSDVSKDLIIRADTWAQRTGAEIRFLHVRSIVNPLDINDLERVRHAVIKATLKTNENGDVGQGKSLVKFYGENYLEEPPSPL